MQIQTQVYIIIYATKTLYIDLSFVILGADLYYCVYLITVGTLLSAVLRPNLVRQSTVDNKGQTAS